MHAMPDLTHWQQWLAATPAEVGTPMAPGLDGEIIDYAEPNGFLLGMALQSADHQVRFYSRTPDGLHVIDRAIPDERVPGPLHRHSYLELGFVVHGCARQIFTDKEYRFQTGDFWITDYQCHHSDLYFHEDLFTMWIGMPRNLFDALFLDAVGQSPVQQFLHTALLRQKERRQFLRFTPRFDDGTTTGIMAQLVMELHTRETGSDSIVRGLLARLLSRLSLAYDCLVEEQEKAQMRRLLYNEVEAFLRANLATVTIDRLTERFHYSSDFYNRLIRRQGGTTYSTLLQRLRLEEAASLLEHTSLPVELVHERIGYQSKGFFYKLFSRQYGMTPGEWRKKAHPGGS